MNLTNNFWDVEKGGLKIFIATFLLVILMYPWNYILSVNLNLMPLYFIVGIATMLLVSKFEMEINNIIITCVFAAYFSIISSYNISNPSDVFTNAIIVSLLIFLFSCYCTELDCFNFNILIRALFWSFLIFALVSVYYNILHYITLGFTIRSKGFGSGTLYGIISLLGMIFYFDLLKYRIFNRKLIIVAIIVFSSSLLLTQSRGIIACGLVVLLISKGNLKLKLKRVVWLIISAIILIFLFRDVLSIDSFLNRLDPTKYSSMEEFTSNRLQMQTYLLEQITSNFSSIEILIGKYLNAVKYTGEHYELEPPHLDPLYIVYDGGVVSLCLFYTLILYVIVKAKSFKYLFVYAFSGLHANMILVPQYYVLVFLLTLVFKFLEKDNYES